MIIVKTIEALNQYLDQLDPQTTVGLVPTMGYLHAGHLSLIEAARLNNAVVIVSIFVNPTQFGPNEDLAAYPRDFEHDRALAEEAGADLIFCPEVETIYPQGASTFVTIEGEMPKKLCGQQRPIHFKGVTTIVSILFHLVRPDNAYFGQKDAQQVILIKKMVRDLHMKVNIVTCPIVREADGLAMSSRNVYLGAEERQQALILSQSLQAAKKRYQAGERNVAILKAAIADQIRTMPLAEIDYADLLDLDTLSEIDTIEKSALAAVAVRFGKTRLLDNLIFD